MFLTAALRGAIVAVAVAATTPVAASLAAQETRGGESRARVDSLRPPGPSRLQPEWRAVPRAFSSSRLLACDSLATCSMTIPRAVDDVSADQRGKFALIGLVVGAAAGWGAYAYQCTHGSDCYSPVGGLLLAAAGGVVGLLVGILVAPGPGPP